MQPYEVMLKLGADGGMLCTDAAVRGEKQQFKYVSYQLSIIYYGYVQECLYPCNNLPSISRILISYSAIYKKYFDRKADLRY